MDAPSLVTLAAVVVAAVVIVPRVVLESAGRASDGIAALFVPPDRALGWPRGVQEGDDPWGWRSPADVTRVQAAAMDERSLDRPVLVDFDGPDPAWFVSDATIVDLGIGDVVVPVRRVTRD
ncbi:MAG TPA: hypothetical protein VID95_12015 [Candidatus Limnocylindrales bacterium]|jgi:hypothetical protein